MTEPVAAAPLPSARPDGPRAARRLAWIDPGHGIAGDMLLGALVDAGASLAQVQEDVDRVVPDTLRLWDEEVVRGGMRGRKVRVDLLVDDQPHRRWAEIDALLASAGLHADVARGSRLVFAQIAEAEARCHGVPVEHVQFHEVGAWGSIADVVGCCSALVQLGLDEVVAGDVALGSGTVRMAHGELTVPGPAVVELAAGWPTRPGRPGLGELTTPTGMALLRVATHVSAMPAMTVERVGVGAGTKDFPDHPNVVRVVIGAAPDEHAADAPRGSADAIPAGEADSQVPGLTRQERLLLECNVDDMDPRLWPGVLDALLTAGADDAWLTPILMKKGRPAHTLAVLVDDTCAGPVRDEIFTRTSTLGVRERVVARHVLDRRWCPIDVDGRLVRVRVGVRGHVVVNAQPEFEDVRVAAAALGCPEAEVLALANSAAVEAGLVPGSELLD